MRKVIAITGASAGIGRAAALRLARDGHAVVVSARRREALQQTVDDIERGGGTAHALVADVTREEDMRRLVAGAIEKYLSLIHI